ncbi:MAG: hypothetical protein D6778_06700, partial [Nitrospirae bacterium]
ILISEGLLVVYLALASVVAITVLKRWDPASATETQLSLERRTYLISTVMAFVMGINLLDLFLFVYTVDDLHKLFVGAMCATGTLNANPVGWKALVLKTALWFISALWLIINHLDQKTETFPLVRTKYALLLVISPLYVLDLVLTWLYFKGLDPSVITSCCGALFSESGTKLTSTLSTLPPYETMVVFFVCTGLLTVGFVLNLKWKTSSLRYGLSVMGLLYLLVSIASVVAFISVYYYELPTHHCPFDILQREYHFVGYPLYGSLFIGTLCAMATGLTEFFRKKQGIETTLPKLQKKLLLTGLSALMVFLAFVVYPMLFSEFSLFGY